MKSFDKHEFYEILLGHYRSRNQLANAQHDLEVLKRETESEQERTWQTESFSMIAKVGVITIVLPVELMMMMIVFIAPNLRNTNSGHYYFFSSHSCVTVTIS